jgi:hypothetical protein
VQYRAFPRVRLQDRQAEQGDDEDREQQPDETGKLAMKIQFLMHNDSFF